MESPSPKRRRTSPHASIPVNASNTDLSAINDDRKAQIFSQPSYMTPTKASLARFHPHLVARPSHSTTPRSKGRLLLDQRSSTLNGSLRSSSKVLESPYPDSFAKSSSINRVARALANPRAGDSNQTTLTEAELLSANTISNNAMADMIEANKRSRQRLASVTPNPAAKPTPIGPGSKQWVNTKLPPTEAHVPSSIRSTSSAPGPSQDVADQEPRASPPPEAAGEAGSIPATVSVFDEAVADISRESPQLRVPDLDAQVLARSSSLDDQGIEARRKTTTGTDHDGKSDGSVAIFTPTRNKAAFAEDGEPKLPSTPRQLGIEPPGGKPTGILSISPSRKGKRRRAPSTKSSPLKPKNAAPVRHVFETEFENSLGPRPHLTFASGEVAHAPLEHRLERDSAFSVMPTYSISKLSETDPLYDIQDTVSLGITVSDTVSSKGGLHTTFRDVVLRSPSDVLTAEIRMFLKDSGKVASIAVIGITSWASELGKWLNAPIADRTQDAIVRAVGRFWDMAEIRAFCWYKCEGDLKHLLDATGHVSSEKASDTAETPSDKNGAELAIKSHIEQPEPGSVSEAFPVERLYRCMGLNSMHLRDSAVTLEFTWTVNFTPSGKVTSRVSAHASFPPYWAEEDGDDLTRIDEAFKRLVQSGKLIYEAVRCIAEVMFPDSKG